MFKYYKPVETTPQIERGYYEAKIAKAEFKTAQSGNEFLELTFEVDGHLGAKPNKAQLFDTPKNESFKGQVESNNRSLTLFFDNFGITRGEQNLQNYIGKTGTISIFPQANGYNAIAPYKLTEKQMNNRIKKAEEGEKKQNAPQAPQNPQVQQFAPPPMGGYNPQTTGMQGFPDEAPF